MGHVYMVRAGVTTGVDVRRVCLFDDDDRQLALIRLPSDRIVGPCRCLGVATVSEDRWTEIPGLSATVTVAQSHDKLLITAQTNFNPAGMEYEAYFTIFRSSSTGSLQNLGHDSQGMWSVASASTGSSEYPVLMFTDGPGAGTYTYSVYVRSRRCESLQEPQAIEVGPDGQISVLMLSNSGSSLMEMMAAEMQGARNSQT